MLKENQKIYVFSGAGISAPSGVTTFRDNGGIWYQHLIDEVCNALTFVENYEKVHNFYNERRVQLADIEPNNAHILVKELQDKYGVDSVINVTTNVDNLFEKAGVKNTLYLHGKIWEMKNVDTDEVTDIGFTKFDYSDVSTLHKPNVTFFYEISPEYETLHNMQNFDMKTGDILIFIGMSFQVLPAYSFLPNSPTTKVHTFNINLNGTDEDHLFDKTYNGCVLEMLPIALSNVEKLLQEQGELLTPNQ